MLIDYLVLPGEIHTVTQVPAGDSVGNVARAFGNVLSRWVREMQPVRSPVLAGPYRAQPLSSVDGLREEARMLGWRPVYLGLCSTPTPCATRRVGNAMRRRPSDEEWRAWELARGLQMATGSVGPRPTMARAVHGPAAALVAAGRTYDVDGALALLAGWVAARIKTSDVLDLHGGSSAMDARGRALVACLAVDHRLCSASSVARYFRKAKATLSEQMAACRARAADRRILETPVRRILEEAAALRAVGKSKPDP